MSDNTKKGLVEWIQRGDNTYIPSEKVRVKSKVPAGLYSIKFTDNIGYYMFKETFYSDDILTLPVDTIDRVINDINKFWQRGDKFSEYGLAHKRGVLLYGKAGTGKSCLINLLITDLINNLDGIVISIKNRHDLESYANFLPEYLRLIEPNRPIVTILEDIDGLIEYSETETLLLNLLDGLEQMEKIVYIATTNYTERLKERILNRPSRFDLRVEIKAPTPEIRKYYFENKLKADDLKNNDINEWVKLSEGFTMAHLREMIVSIVVLDNTLESTIEKLNELSEIPHSSQYSKHINTNVGFNYRKPIKTYKDEVTQDYNTGRSNP